MDTWRQMQATLEELAAGDLIRRPVTLQSPVGPRAWVAGRELVCLCSNDYLSLACDPVVKAAAVAAVQQWGVGAGASRQVCGSTDLHERLEARLAEFKHTAGAIVTPTGWMANHAAIAALAGAGDLILSDKGNHASIIDAARACGARLRTYAHADVGRLAVLLSRHRGGCRRCLIVTDTLFSMNGDLAPLAELVELKDRFDAQLLVDEAHATGVLGERGGGAGELAGVEDRIDATVGTLSKALGGLGGFVAGPDVLIDTIRNSSRAFIYTTALPPALCAATIAALDIVRDEPSRRRDLLAAAERLRGQLHGADLPTAGAVAQIIPVIVGGPAHALALSAALLEEGLLIPAIRPPTVPPGTSRLRISLCFGHDQRDLDRLAETIVRLVPIG